MDLLFLPQLEFLKQTYRFQEAYERITRLASELDGDIYAISFN